MTARMAITFALDHLNWTEYDYEYTKPDAPKNLQWLLFLGIAAGITFIVVAYGIYQIRYGTKRLKREPRFDDNPVFYANNVRNGGAHSHRNITSHGEAAAADVTNPIFRTTTQQNIERLQRLSAHKNNEPPRIRNPSSDSTSTTSSMPSELRSSVGKIMAPLNIIESTHYQNNNERIPTGAKLDFDPPSVSGTPETEKSFPTISTPIEDIELGNYSLKKNTDVGVPLFDWKPRKDAQKLSRTKQVTLAREAIKTSRKQISKKKDKKAWQSELEFDPETNAQIHPNVTNNEGHHPQIQAIQAYTTDNGRVRTVQIHSRTIMPVDSTSTSEADVSF